MLTDTPRTEALEKSSVSASTKLLAIACALLVTAALLGGYFFVRTRFAQNRAVVPAPAENTRTTPKGPAKVQILVDEPFIKNRESVIGGTVRNISTEELPSLEVVLALRTRRDGQVEERLVPVEPPQLAPNQDGRYEIRLRAQEYGGVKLVGIKSGSVLISYSTAEGRRRPVEVTPSKSVTLQRPAPRGGEEFLNTPDNPGRVP